MKAKGYHPDRPAQRTQGTAAPKIESLELLRDREVSASEESILTGREPNGAWQRAGNSEEGGDIFVTPDQDPVDEIGEALGVPQTRDAEVRTSAEILQYRDRHYWDLERRAARRDRST